MAISQRSLTDLTDLSSSEFGAVQGAEISQVHCALLGFSTFCVSTASLERLRYAINNTKLEIYSYYIHMIAHYYYKSCYYYNEVFHMFWQFWVQSTEKDLGANLFISKIHIECLIKFKTFVLFLFQTSTSMKYHPSAKRIIIYTNVNEKGTSSKNIFEKPYTRLSPQIVRKAWLLYFNPADFHCLYTRTYTV